MALCGASKEIAQIISALGLNPERIRSFILRASVGEVITLTVEYLPDTKDIDVEKLIHVFQICSLEEIKKK